MDWAGATNAGTYFSWTGPTNQRWRADAPSNRSSNVAIAPSSSQTQPALFACSFAFAVTHDLHRPQRPSAAASNSSRNDSHRERVNTRPRTGAFITRSSGSRRGPCPSPQFVRANDEKTSCFCVSEYLLEHQPSSRSRPLCEGHVGRALMVCHDQTLP